MKISQLKIDNYMRLTAVNVDMNGHDVVITGKNEVGKSSAINAIWVALTGKEIPKEPIQKGKESAEIKLKISREDGMVYTVTRKFKRGGEGSLKVSTEDIPKLDSPQTFLNKLIGEISFDPFEFINKQPREKKKYLQGVLKIDTDDLEARKKMALAKKKAREDELVAFEKQLEEYPEFEGTVERREVSEVEAKQSEIRKQQDEKKRLIDLVNEHATQYRQLSAEIVVAEKAFDGIDAQIKRLLEEKDKVLNHLVDMRNKKDSIQALGVIAKEDEQKYIVDDISEVTNLLTEINEHNKRVDQYEQKQKLVAQMAEVEKKRAAAIDEVAAIEQERVSLISSVKMPVPGLDFSEEGITFEGLPFEPDQFSTAKMNMIGFQISVALNPKLKILRVKDWVLMDSETKELLTALARENDFQMFIETVTDDKEIGFVIQGE